MCALSSRSAVSNALALPPQMHPPFAFWAHRKWTWRKAKSRWYCAARRTPIRRPTLCGVGPVAPKSPVCRFVRIGLACKRTQSRSGAQRFNRFSHNARAQESLQLRPVARRDAGVYTCQAQNSVGTSEPMSVQLDIKCEYLEVTNPHITLFICLNNV